MKLFMNTTLFDVQNDVNCISEDLDFKLFWEIMPPPLPPATLKGLFRRFFFLLLPLPHSRLPLMSLVGKFLKSLCLNIFNHKYFYVDYRDALALKHALDIK